MNDADLATAALHREQVRRGGFRAFIKVAWDQVVPDPLIYEPHMDVIADHYEAILRNEIKDLVVNVPPGTSKSTISSILFPVYAWIVDPKLKLMFTSYDEQLTALFAETSLNLIRSDWFKARWPEVVVRDETRANKTLYDTTAGGRRISTMMGGKATGKHAHILFVDDPHKPDDLDGDPDAVKEVLDLAWRRWINTFSKRRADPKRFRRVCIMQRLHMDDLAGRMLKVPGVVHVCLPSEFNPERACVTKWGRDWRTRAGELLSERFPEEVIESDRREMSPREFSAQHDQNPVPANGTLLLREWFEQTYVVPPNGLSYFMSIDANLKDRKDSDYCVIQVWAANATNSSFYLIDQARGRWDFNDAALMARTMRERYPKVRNILVEDKANGTAIISQLKGLFPGVIAINPEGGKQARVEACTWLLRAGSVVFPEGRKFVEELVDEAASFPVGSHDDMVDAMSQFLVWITGGKRSKRGLFKKAMANVAAGKDWMTQGQPRAARRPLGAPRVL